MLDPEYLRDLPEAVLDLYRDAELRILEDMARRLAAYDYWIPSVEHQKRALQEAGRTQEEIVSVLSGITGKSDHELRQMMQDAGTKALRSDSAEYVVGGLDPPDIQSSKRLRDVLNAGYRATRGTMRNITRTTAKTASGQFERALDRAWMEIQSGGIDYGAAIRNAVKDLSKSGVQSVRYSSSRTDSLEVAVRRAVVTGVNQTALQLQWDLAEEVGCDLVETTAHAGARPSHALWQGQVFSRSGQSSEYPDFRAATGYGTGAGLGGWNCRHSYHPYFDGAPRAYSADQIDQYNAKRYTYNGRELTEYEASQLQRHCERKIRRWQREYAAMEAAGQDTAEAAAKIRQWREQIDDFLRQTRLKQQFSREQTPTFGRRQFRSIGKQYSIAERLARSVGAKAKNYDVYNPKTGEIVHLAEGTHITQPKNHVMAGKGRNREIDEIQGLLDNYGGDAVQWTIEKGYGYVEDEYGELHQVELHWYQEPTVGKVKMKIKVQPDGRIYLDED